MRRVMLALALLGSLLLTGTAPALAGSHLGRTAPKGTTTTTVMGGGSPATWPAAKPYPPSLAGAYSPNMKTAFLTLVNYSDWVGSHPNPNLVKNFAAPTSDIYRGQVYLMQQMRRRGLHLPPTPSQVDFLVVTRTPHLRRSPQGKLLYVAGRPAYTSGSLAVVIDEVTAPYLNAQNRVVGYTPRGTGPKPWAVILSQDPATGRFVISAFYSVILHSSIQEWEKQITKFR
jgi:hypothetical protein